MTEDDRTIDADDGMLDELRRLAADARAQAESGQGPDETVDADGSTMDLLRQFAAEARADASTPSAAHVDPDQTPPGGFEALPSETQDPPDALLEPPDRATASPPRQPSPPPAPDLFPQIASPPAAPVSNVHRSSLPPLNDLIEPRSEASTSPAPDSRTSSWRPPPRMVMPAEPERGQRPDSHRWRNVSLALAVVLIVVLAFLGYSALTGDDSPSDEVPEELPIDGIPAEPETPVAPDEGSDGG